MIGQMRQKITIQSPVSTAVGGGGVETTYTEVLTDWVEARPLSSSRELSEYQTVIKNGYRFTIRYRNGFTPDKSMLIVYKGKNYTVNSIEQVEERQKYWRIVGVEKS
ncbi:phage head closure protein [Chitinophaga sp.]|uniref:phage head closure protein n=1 Tax=Chitinophaga sp. TaxID=1869181 RepID=UPI0031DAA56D